MKKFMFLLVILTINLLGINVTPSYSKEIMACNVKLSWLNIREKPDKKSNYKNSKKLKVFLRLRNKVYEKVCIPVN